MPEIRPAPTVASEAINLSLRSVALPAFDSEKGIVLSPGKKAMLRQSMVPLILACSGGREGLYDSFEGCPLRKMGEGSSMTIRKSKRQNVAGPNYPVQAESKITII